jgi:hypothetical protein
MGKASVTGGTSRNDKTWRRLVDRSRRDPLFVGWALGQYGQVHGLTEDQVLTWLECRGDRRDQLALCRLPDPDESAFPASIRRIADFVGCKADRLVQLFRQVAALVALREGDAGAAGRGLLMAARDRKNPKGPRESGR